MKRKFEYAVYWLFWKVWSKKIEDNPLLAIPIWHNMTHWISEKMTPEEIEEAQNKWKESHQA